MSNLYSCKSKIFKISRFLLPPLGIRRHQRLLFRYLRKGFLMGLVFILIAGWFFSGQPQIGNFPPKIQEVNADSKGPYSPTTDKNSGADWSNRNNAISDEGGASVATAKNKKAVWWGFNFDVPSGATIDGIEVICDAWTGTDGPDKAEIYLSWDGGSSYTAEIEQTWPLTEGTMTSGTPTNTWGRTWSTTEINSDDFRVKVKSITSGKATDNWDLDWIRIEVYYSTGPSTTFLIGGTETGTKDTNLTTITFPEGAPEATISAPYNNLDNASDPQILSADSSEPVAKIKNTHDSTTYNIVLEITTWTNSVVNMEYYNLAADGATNINAVTSELSNASGAARSVSTGVSIAAGAYKDLYLKLLLGSVAGKSSTSTLTVLGET